MRKSALILFSLLLLCTGICSAQQRERIEMKPVRSGFAPAAPRAESGVVSTIGKYLAAGDAQALSAWFAPNLEVAVLSAPADCSRSQARQILTAFFKSYVPRSFRLLHQAGRENLKYALGDLTAGGEIFRVTVFMSFGQDEGDSFKIQQLKIER